MSRGRRRDVGATSARHGDKSIVKCLILGAFLLVSASHGRRGVAEIPTRSVERSHARTPIKTCSILSFTLIQGGPLKEQNTPNPLDTCACCALGDSFKHHPGWLSREQGSQGAKESLRRATCIRVQRIWSILLLQGATLDPSETQNGAGFDRCSRIGAINGPPWDPGLRETRLRKSKGRQGIPQRATCTRVQRI